MQIGCVLHLVQQKWEELPNVKIESYYLNW